MKFTFIGYAMRKSWWTTRLDTETAKGLTGWAATPMIVYSWPFKLIDLFFIVLKRVTSVCVQHNITPSFMILISITSVFWYGL